MLGEFNGKIDIVEEKISYLKDLAIETIQKDIQRENIFLKRSSLAANCQKTSSSLVFVIGVSEDNKQNFKVTDPRSPVYHNQKKSVPRAYHHTVSRITELVQT